jgi:hypothetical protein
MYDGINSLAAGIRQRFPDAAMVAGYIDGRFVWTQAEWNLFPHALHVLVAVSSSTNAGDVIDCEAGDATPAEAAAWVRMRRAAGYYRPTIYCSRSVIPAVRQATGNLVLGRDYDIWCADYTGQPHQVTAPGSPAANCAATQYLNTNAYDASIVYDDGWPHRSAPAAKPSGDWVFGPPRDLRMANVGPSSVKLAWSSPGTPMPAGVSGYQVTIREGGRDLPSYPRTVAKTGTSELVQLGSLPPGKALEALVRALAAGEQSHAGKWATVEFTTT